MEPANRTVLDEPGGFWLLSCAFLFLVVEPSLTLSLCLPRAAAHREQHGDGRSTSSSARSSPAAASPPHPLPVLHHRQHESSRFFRPPRRQPSRVRPLRLIVPARSSPAAGVLSALPLASLAGRQHAPTPPDRAYEHGGMPICWLLMLPCWATGVDWRFGVEIQSE